MSFERHRRGKTARDIATLMSIFGTVEVRQMRELFAHIPAKKYNIILKHLADEGYVFMPPGGKYLSVSKSAMEKRQVHESVDTFWAFIKFRDEILDFSACDPPALVTFTSGKANFDLIPINGKALALMADEDYDVEDRTVRLFVVSSLDDLSDISIRSENDYAVVVDLDGVTDMYEL